MLIFNTTYKVATEITEKWLRWLKKEHIPFMLISEQFTTPQIVKVVGSEDEQGISYSVQFKIRDMETLMAWHKSFATEFQHNCQTNFGTEVTFFSTVLEVIE